MRRRGLPHRIALAGAAGRTLWVVSRRGGAVAPATTDVRRFNPLSVPCDIRLAFAKPSP